jgi:hypothetical protein
MGHESSQKDSTCIYQVTTLVLKVNDQHQFPTKAGIGGPTKPTSTALRLKEQSPSPRKEIPMPAYMMSHVTITNKEKFDSYLAKTKVV